MMDLSGTFAPEHVGPLTLTDGAIALLNPLAMHIWGLLLYPHHVDTSL